jgi:hypothetical protein
MQSDKVEAKLIGNYLLLLGYIINHQNGAKKSGQDGVYEEGTQSLGCPNLAYSQKHIGKYIHMASQTFYTTYLSSPFNLFLCTIVDV